MKFENEELKNKRIVDLVATVPEVSDKEGDVVPEDEIDDSLDAWMIRGAPMSDIHTDRIVGKGIRWWHGDNNKRIIRSMVFSDSKTADDVWDKITNEDLPEDEKYKSASIAGAAFNQVPNDSGGMDLKGLEITAVAFCPDGMHQDANIIERNELAKSTSFFMKADLRYNDSYKLITKKEKLDFNGGSNMKKQEVIEEPVVEKPEGQYVSIEDFNALKATVQQIAEAVAGKPEEVAQAEETEEEKPKPEEEEEKVDKEAGFDNSQVGNPEDQGIGVKDKTGEGKGEVVKLPVTVDEKREPQGEPSEEPTDDSDAALTEKQVKGIVTNEFKKMGLKKSMTPLPRVEKSAGPREAQYPALDVLSGKKKVNDFFSKSKIDALQTKIDGLKAFEGYYKGVQ